MTTNRQSFNITQNKKTSFNIIPFAIRSSFSVYVNKKSTFDLIIYGFNLIEKYWINFGLVFGLSTVSKVTMKGLSSMNNILTFIAETKQSLKGNTIFSNILNLNLIPKEIGKGSIILSIVTELIVNSKIGLVSTTDFYSPFGLSFSPEVRQYYTLAEHDIKTLADMDVLTLQELDYHVI